VLIWATILPSYAVAALEPPPAVVQRFSIGTGHSAAVSPQGFTLLDPDWLLPPSEFLEASSAERADQMLHSDGTVASLPAAPAADGPLSYSLSDDLTADLRYHHSQLFGRGDSQTAREEAATVFSTRPDRDVFDLNMSWHLAGNTLGLGYQLESARSGSATDVGLSRFLPGNQQAVQSLTLGLTRAWGASEPPMPIEPVLALPVAAAVDPSPTPQPR
jgi:hypothetical protein